MGMRIATTSVRTGFAMTQNPGIFDSLEVGNLEVGNGLCRSLPLHSDDFVAAVCRAGKGAAVVGCHGVHEVLCVLYAGTFKSGVHGQLGQADVGGGDGYMAQGDVAQS